MAAIPFSAPFSSIVTWLCGFPKLLYIPVRECIRVIMCMFVLWATLSFMVRDSNPVFEPDNICSVHIPFPEALIPSDLGASADTRPYNVLLTWLSGLPPTSQRQSISPQSL